jgi:hypothetical protein
MMHIADSNAMLVFFMNQVLRIRLKGREGTIYLVPKTTETRNVSVANISYASFRPTLWSGVTVFRSVEQRLQDMLRCDCWEYVPAPRAIIAKTNAEHAPVAISIGRIEDQVGWPRQP